MGKLGSILGIPIKTDRYTLEKTRLHYARLLIDIKLDESFPDFIEFVNDQDVVVRLKVEYEWKPIKCQHCKMFGHTKMDCKKKANVRQEWRRKVVQHGQEKDAAEPSYRTVMAPPEPQHSTDEDGFTLVQRPASRFIPRNNSAVALHNANSFASLQDTHEGQENMQ